MGYDFKGFFTDNLNYETFCHELAHLPVVVKQIENPFHGLGVKLDEDESYDDESFEAFYEQEKALVSTIKSLSIQFPKSTFAWIEVKCFGGTCLYIGFVMQNGIQQFSKIEYDSDPTILPKILSFLGITLADNLFFEPFTRGYWQN
ncbi:MAG: hypothetical protein KC445_17365 [Anaerolineales bacterium]|nr:hypothetical protein [Anaerolineales bacterium]